MSWDSVAAHEQGFRGSPRYAEWKALLHHFYDPFPTVLHYMPIDLPPTAAVDGLALAPDTGDVDA